ncbi:MAG: phosphatase PAP2 family protein [Clostridia bacterium]|nr:phosphatase PAP2 family protein [Clostridia bacterium]
MEIAIVKFFQGLSSGFADVFFWIVTKLGEETFFMFILLGIYLCYDKMFSVKYSMYYLLSVGINNLIKVVVGRPRPYVKSNEIVDRLHATGKSFPSGHTQGYFVQASTMFNELNKKNNNKKLKTLVSIILAVFGILLMISRMFWGQHYLSDVCVGMMFGLVLPFLFDWLLSFVPKKWKDAITPKRVFVFLGILSSVLFVLFLILELTVGFYSRKVYKFLGVFIAISLGYFVDNKWIRYESNQGWKIGCIKFILSICVVSLLYWVISLIVPIVTFVYFIVYLFLGLVCTILLPMLFKILFKEKVDSGKGNSK